MLSRVARRLCQDENPMTTHTIPTGQRERKVRVSAGSEFLDGTLVIPDHASGVVLFAHGSGSSRFSPRNRFVAESLQQASFGTLLIDLLTREEEAVDQYTAHLRFDIGLLADRLLGATQWLAEPSDTAELPVGYFGASTGAGAALMAAAQLPERVTAVVSRGGRPDLAGEALPAVQAATLLIVGGMDEAVLALNQEALGQLGSTEKELVVVPGSSHLFDEPGKLELVARLAADWFRRHLR
jgi:pimeloyl-ACP methyl ester carboxylesterase